MSEPQIFRMRVRYQKQGRLKYLGHLEVLHTVERIIRRAHLPYAITQGFSPHMKIAFGTALPVGTASDCEYFDLFLTEAIDTQEALKRLIAASPKDLAPSEAQYLEPYGESITVELQRADYRLDIVPSRAFSLDELIRAVERTVACGRLPYARGNKTKELDLSHTLVSWQANREDGNNFVIELISHSDNEGSIRPDIFLQAVDAFLAGEGLDGLSLSATEYHCFERAGITRTLVARELAK